MTLGRRFAGVIVVALAFVVSLAGFSPRTAKAATAYRYWTYYIAAPNTAAWTYSQRGPAFEHPQDGEVQGWRFAIQADRSGDRTPRFAADFGKLCASQPATPGKVRVGVVLDFGVAGDAPAGEHPPANVVTGCVEVADGASGVDVLDAAVGAANVRIGQGLICGIEGYPKTECAVAVTAPAATTSTGVTPTTAKPPTATAKSTVAPTATPSAPATAATPTAAASRPSGTTAPPSAGPSSTATPPSASATSSITSLAALKKPKQKVFPTGAVIGVVLILGLAVAALVRGSGARR